MSKSAGTDISANSCSAAKAATWHRDRACMAGREKMGRERSVQGQVSNLRYVSWDTTAPMPGSGRQGISGSSKPTWNEDEQRIRYIERRRGQVGQGHQAQDAVRRVYCIGRNFAAHAVEMLAILIASRPSFSRNTPIISTQRANFPIRPTRQMCTTRWSCWLASRAAARVSRFRMRSITSEATVCRST